MIQDKITNEYFKWLSDLVSGGRFSKLTSYSKLLMRLHDIPFRYKIPKDQNRAEDGANLRYRFALFLADEYPPDLVTNVLDGPCSVLEMMIALSIRCETNIMDDPNVGDRTAQWFWGMIANLGLGSMIDNRFDKRYIDEVISRFLDRKYDADGKGGLFRIRDCDRDLRTVEIWHQLCWYLDSIV